MGCNASQEPIIVSNNENGTIVEDNDGKQPPPPQQSNAELELSTDNNGKQQDNKTMTRDTEGILIGNSTVKTSENGSPIDKAATTTTNSASSRSSQSAATTTAEEGAQKEESNEICSNGANDLLANNLPNSINETNRNDSSSTIELLEFGAEEGTYLDTFGLCRVELEFWRK